MKINFIGFGITITLDGHTLSGKNFFVSFDHSPPIGYVLDYKLVAIIVATIFMCNLFKVLCVDDE